MTGSDKRDGYNLTQTRRNLPIALLRAREAVMENFRPLLAANDVTEQQWRVLRVLAEVEEADATFVANKACILAPSLTRIIKSLESRGLIVSRKDLQDGRKTLMGLTSAGSDFINSIAPHSVAIYAEIEKKIGAAELKSLLDQIDHLLDALQSR